MIVRWEVFGLSKSSPGGPGMARTPRDPSNTYYSGHGQASLSKSMWCRWGGAAVLAPGGLNGVGGRSPYVWLCVCRLIETTFPTGVWGRRRRALSRGRAAPAGGRRSLGGSGIARARRDLSHAHRRVQIHAGLSKSMWRGRGGPRALRRMV